MTSICLPATDPHSVASAEGVPTFTRPTAKSVATAQSDTLRMLCSFDAAVSAVAPMSILAADQPFRPGPGSAVDPNALCCMATTAHDRRRRPRRRLAGDHYRVAGFAFWPA